MFNSMKRKKQSKRRKNMSHADTINGRAAEILNGEDAIRDFGNGVRGAGTPGGIHRVLLGNGESGCDCEHHARRGGPGAGTQRQS